MSIKVLKFGGSSQSISTYKMILNIIKNDPNNKYIIVLSALKQITDHLLEFIHTKNFSWWDRVLSMNKSLCKDVLEIDKDNFIMTMEKTNWNIDKDNNEIVAMGEFFTTNILNEYLLLNEIKSKFISSFDVIKSNLPNQGLYNKGEFSVNTNILTESFINNQILIIPGFSGTSSDGFPCLLGRGGSDTTGSILAMAMNASIYEIWTDVNGIYSCDPRIIENTHIIPKIGYTAAQEIAAMGGKVIHPYSIFPCAKNKIPIVIKNSFEQNAKINTIISNQIEQDNIYAITIQPNIKVYKITSMNMWNNYGFVYDIFGVFKKYNIDVNIISTSQFNITTTTEDKRIEILLLIKKELEEKYTVEFDICNTIVSIVGENINKYNNIGTIFKITQKYNIILISYSSNDMALSWIVKNDDAHKLAQEIHNNIFVK